MSHVNAMLPLDCQMPVDCLFRLDADSQIGTGHLMRCLAIADALAADGWQCGFLCRPLTAGLQSLLGKHRYLPVADEPAALAMLERHHPRWLVVDHYGLDRVFEHAARQYVRHLLVIDDLADRPHDADLLLDQGPLRTVADYQPLVGTDCQLLLGTAYALLRPAFAGQRRTACSPFRHGLIGFGGADPAHAGFHTLTSLAQTPWLTQCRWTLLAGAANPDLPRLQQLIHQHHWPVELLTHTHDVAGLLAQHDFAIGAAGGMLWERCCVGLPTVCVPIVDNQVFNDQVIARYQLGERLTLAQLQQPQALDAALKQLQTLADNYRQRGQDLVDGQGLARLTSLLRNRDL